MFDQFFTNTILGQMILNINFNEEIIIELILPKNIEMYLYEFSKSNEKDCNLKFFKNDVKHSFWIEDNKSLDTLLEEVNKMIDFSLEKELKNKILKEKILELENYVNSYSSKDLVDLLIVLKN